jgi:hypothetical protein
MGSNPAIIGGKADQFPVEDEGTRAMSPADDLHLEKPLMLDPCLDNPDDFFHYSVDGQVMPIAENPPGRATIDICFLNRSDLQP